MGQRACRDERANSCSHTVVVAPEQSTVTYDVMVKHTMLNKEHNHMRVWANPYEYMHMQVTTQG